MKRGLAQFSVWASAFALYLSASAANDPFLQLSSPIFTNGQVQFTLTGESGVSYVIESSLDAKSWSPVMTNANYGITRVITLEATNELAFYRVWRSRMPIFDAAIIARQNISLNGNYVRFSSYDSGDPLHDDPVNPAEVKAGGDLATGTGFLGVGNGGVHGMLKTGPSGSYAFGPNGFAGPTNWTGPGLYSGDWYRNDFRFTVPDVAAPFSDGVAPPIVVGTNQWILSPAANYYVSGNMSVPAAKTLLVVGGVVRLYVTGNFTMASSSEIKIESGAILLLFVGRNSGPNSTTSLARINTISPGVQRFQYFGLPTNTGVTWVGPESFSGTIYAPQAGLSLGGGGASPYDFAGACVVNSVVINSHFNFYYDENLKRVGPFR